MNGGYLVQHCSNHAIGKTHEITNGTMGYQITSTHHQMQYPYNLDKQDYDVLYWAAPMSEFWEGDKIDANDKAAVQADIDALKAVIAEITDDQQLFVS